MQDTVPSVGETSATRDSAGPSLSGSDRDTAQIQVKREEEYPGKSLLIVSLCITMPSFAEAHGL